MARSSGPTTSPHGGDNGFSALKALTDRPPVRAILGPTNTGKTYLAIERMLSHKSGIIGFPLRLLARENYDKMVALKGAAHVALITGEEKIIPPGARWFSCTVEAMPTDRSVSFLAVDEIQLCADPDRGHVFTDRLLNARGRDETLFLGSETIAPLMKKLVPGITIESRPRLSALHYAGKDRLARLPARSAIVAFTAADIYAIAELIRSRRGGCAVVMGQMSPRTRNAQVALYQNREVDYLVATDAIGMGLNMDISHVAFAGLSKFDGRHRRNLTPAEIAQIAGRAGRGTKDGTFGTAGTCPTLPDTVAEAVETHNFDPLNRLSWRNSKLDFTSPRQLLASLSRPSPNPCLQAGEIASDVLTLMALMADPDIIARANGRKCTTLLWETCQIPDFRKLGERHHAQLCGRIFATLVSDGVLPDEWLDAQLSSLTRTDGDVDTLMQRLSGVRIWSYIAAHENWVRQASLWQDRARNVEDMLSDALHERLTARFVDRRAAHLIRRLDEDNGGSLLSAVKADGGIVVEGHDVGQLRGFDFVLHDDIVESDRKLLRRLAQRAVATEIPRQVAKLCAEPDSAFSLDLRSGSILYDEIVLANLKPGRTPLTPEISLSSSGLPEGNLKNQVRRRLEGFLRSHINHILAPLTRLMADSHADATLRGLYHQLSEGLGFAEHIQHVPDTRLVRATLKAAGIIRSGNSFLLPSLLRPSSATLRALLLAIFNNQRQPQLPPDGATSSPADKCRDTSFLKALGWLPTGPVLLRADIAFRLKNDLHTATAKGPAPLPADLASRLGIRTAFLAPLLREIGFRLTPPELVRSDLYGPPAPALIFPITARQQNLRKHRMPHPEGAFAALAVLLNKQTQHQPRASRKG